MHIKRAIVVSMRHVAWRGKIIECDPITSNMPHGNGHTPHNMHATDLASISKDFECHCESFDMQTMTLACILREP